MGVACDPTEGRNKFQCCVEGSVIGPQITRRKNHEPLVGAPVNASRWSRIRIPPDKPCLLGGCSQSPITWCLACRSPPSLKLAVRALILSFLLFLSIFFSSYLAALFLPCTVQPRQRRACVSRWASPTSFIHCGKWVSRSCFTIVGISSCPGRSGTCLPHPRVGMLYACARACLRREIHVHVASLFQAGFVVQD